MLNYINLLSLFIIGSWQNAYVPDPVPTPRHKFTVIAHRGDHVHYPENTLAAYAEAIKNGADYVEIDLRTTKDGKLISMHDATVDRMTDGTGQVKDIDFADLEKLHVKTKNNTADTVYKIPTFEEILRSCKNKIYIYIDFKEADPALVYPILKKYGMEKQVLVYINKPTQFTDWHAVAPKMPLMVSLPDSVKTDVDMKVFIDKYKPDVLDGDYRQYTTQMLTLAKSYHLTVWPDGQSASEDAKVWDEALAKGLTGLQTDHPGEFVKYLSAKGVR